jgi:hypothetical protein
MKKIVLIAVLIFCFCAAKAQTTFEEYSYLLYGKLDKHLPGNNLKKLRDPIFLNFKDATRSTIIYELYRDTSSKPCALLVSYQKQGFPIVLLCIPSDNSPTDVITAYQDRLNQISTSIKGTAWLQTIIFSLGVYAMR